MISVIIPTLNEEKKLSNILNDLKNQDFLNYEVIVSDGNSKDKTQFIARQNNCRLVVSDINSPAHQRNKGVEEAKYLNLLFLDADSRIPRNFLKNAYNEFIKRDLGVASFYLRFNSKKFIYKIYNFLYNSFCFVFQYFKPLSVGAAIMVKKEKHKKINGFDETIYVGEDHEYARQIKKIAKFRMLKSTFFYFSPRRWEKEGHIKSLLKIFKMSLYMTFYGPIRKKIVDYEFGDFNK